MKLKSVGWLFGLLGGWLAGQFGRSVIIFQKDWEVTLVHTKKAISLIIKLLKSFHGFKHFYFLILFENNQKYLMQIISRSALFFFAVKLQELYSNRQ